jgi:hypothetical protein
MERWSRSILRHLASLWKHQVIQSSRIPVHQYSIPNTIGICLLTLEHSMNLAKCLVPLLTPITAYQQPLFEQNLSEGNSPNTPSANGSNVPPCPIFNPKCVRFFFLFLCACEAVNLIFSASSNNLDSTRRGVIASITFILPN